MNKIAQLWLMGSSENIISQTLVDRLMIKLYKHNRPSDEVQVWHTCQVTFAIGEDYKDAFWCDVLPIDSGDIFLGCPWIYDKNGTHSMGNTYTFMHGGKQVTLHTIKPEQPKKLWKENDS